MGVPFIECRFRKTQTPQAPPVGIMEHYTYMKEKSARGRVEEYYQKDLYVFWRGSQDFMDWACDASASLTNSQHPDVQIHGGMFARFNEFKGDLEAEMVEFMKQDATRHETTVSPRRIFFVGHSLGAGLAQLSHFQLFAAQVDGHWPSSKELRAFARDSSNGVFMIGFAGPPVFHIKGGQSVTLEAIKLASERGVNVTMEYDLVPRMMNVPYCKQVLKSCTKGVIDSNVDSPLVKIYATGMAKRPVAAIEQQLDKHAMLMAALQHVHPIVVHYFEKNEQIWKWTLITPKFFDVYASFEWPYKDSDSTPMSTLIPVDDHAVFPGKIDTTWGDDVCCICGEVPEGPDAKWQDCVYCQATFCTACYEKKHRDPARAGEIVSWHKPDERSLETKMPGRVAFGLYSVATAQFLSDMQYNAMLCRMAADVFKPTNIWFVADLFRGSTDAGQIAQLIGDAGQPMTGIACNMGVGQAVAKVAAGPAERIFVGAIALAESGWLIYKRWGAGDLDCAQFWTKLCACWGAAAGTAGGMFAGAWVGGLIGSIFGPLGTYAGSLIGSVAGGAIGGAAFRHGTEELIQWASGLNPEDKEKVNWGIISNAMLEMGFGKTKETPSQLQMRELRHALHREALEHHPDKTGLVGKKCLSPEDKERLKTATQKFLQIQTHFGTLAAFIGSRDQEGSRWTKSLLSSLDSFYHRLHANFVKIDKDAQKLKQNAIMGAVTDVGYEK